MTISVIIPAYNQGAYLRQAVQSVLDQTRQDFEIVIVDDGSTDNTKDVAHSFDDARIRYVYQTNRGLSGARNTGICHSSGELVTFLDSDDLNLPEKHALLAAEFEKRPEIGLAAGTTFIIDEHGDRMGKHFESPIPAEPAQFLLWNPLQVCSVMVRREWLERAGPFDETLRACEDWDMYLRLAQAGCPMQWIPAPVSLYRFHTQQMNRDRRRMTDASFAVLQKTYANPALAAPWLAMKDLAYSNAYLRDAMHAFLSGDQDAGKQALDEAVRLDPGLAVNQGRALARRLMALSDSPKIINRLAFLDWVYNHLPDSLDELKRRKNSEMSALAVQLGFDAYQRADLRTARNSLLRAVAYQPKWLTNRGVLSILVRTSLLGVSQPGGSADDGSTSVSG